MKKTLFCLFLALASVGLLGSPAAWGYYSTLSTGDLLDKGHYSANLETQFITDHGSGMNLVGRFDSGLNEDANFRGVVGFGTTDFNLGAYYKWIPIPDTETQPAIGGLIGVDYAHDNKSDDLSLRLHPLVSKKFHLDFGDLSPYAALPFALRSHNGDLDVPLQVAFGAELKTPRFDNLTFWSEIGFNLNHAFTYISLAATVYFDEETGFQIR